MPRPTTKQALIETATTQFSKLWNLIDSISEEKQKATFTFEDRDRNIRDILIHLYEWHQLLIHWVTKNQDGETTSFLPAPYNWKTYSQMNIGFWEKHQNTSYADAITMLKESHDTVMRIIHSFSNEELFTKQYFSWTGTTNLGSYCISATSSHYDWAMKKIKLHIKTS